MALGLGQAFAQTQVANTATVAPPTGITNTNASGACSAGLCASVDTDAVAASRPLVAKSFSPTSVGVGGTSLLTITLTNTHALTSATLAAPLVDSFPSGIVNAATPSAQTSCPGGVAAAAPGAGSLSLSAGAIIPAGGVCTVTAVVTASGATGALVNSIAAGSLTTSLGSNANTATAVLSVTPVVDLSLIKIASTSTPSAGGTLSYSLVLGNAGPSPAVGATFTDTLPAGLGTLTNVTSAVSVGAGTTSFTPTATGLSGSVTIPAGGVVTVTFQVSVAANVTGSIVNVATVSVPAGATDTTPGNNTGTATVTLALAPNATVSGIAYYDINRDRFLDVGDPPLVGFRVELITVTGTATAVVGTATTDANGRYTISGQLPGSNYRVQFRDPTGNTIYGTPFNQATQTQGGQPSTGRNSLTSAISPSQTVAVAGFIDGVTLYAGDNTVNQNLPLDPSGVVYDALQRTPIAGATVRLVGPAGFDPALHLLGGAANASQLTPAIGAYQFLLLSNAPSGVYSLEVTPPNGYANVPAAQGGVAAPQGTFSVPAGVNAIQAQSTPPVQGVTGVGPLGGVGTQYFLQFAFTFPGSGAVLNNHIPLDPLASGAVLISKVGNKTVAELGDSVQYTIRIRNTTGASVAGVKVEDVLPPGFRYILGTARFNNAVIANPDGGVGRNLVFNVGDVAANTTAELTYFVRIGVGSAQGGGVNRATAVFTGPGGVLVRSNTAQYKVNVQGGVFSNEGCIIGKVYADWDGDHMQNNASGSRELGIPGVRLVMLDGTYVITDSEGKYSLCGVKSQTHVIKVDRSTLPRGARMVPSSNRNAGVGDSLFVDLKGGELARADFIEGSRSAEVLDQIKARRAQGGVDVPETESGRPLKIDNNNALGGQQQILPLPRQSGPTPVLPGRAQ